MKPGKKNNYFFLLWTLLALLLPSQLYGASSSSAELRFAELYAQALGAVENGQLGDEAGKGLRVIKSRLTEQTMVLDGKLRKMKAELGDATGDERDEIVDSLMALGSERERMYQNSWKELQTVISNKSSQGIAKSPKSQAPAVEPVTPPQAQESGITVSETGGSILRIENIPEDVGEGLFE
jgi:hypothetical protein